MIGGGDGGEGTKAVLLSLFPRATGRGLSRGPASANVRRQLHLGAGTKPRQCIKSTRLPSHNLGREVGLGVLRASGRRQEGGAGVKEAWGTAA